MNCINNSFSSNLSANSTSLTGNLCSNFHTTPNGNLNGHLNSNLSNNPNGFTNGLNNNLSSSLSGYSANGLTNNNLGNNFSNSYYDYQAHNSSSNSSSIALSSEYDYNQQNLVTNLNESNLNSNVIPPFYQTFSQGVSVKGEQANHLANDYRIDSLVGGSSSLICSNNSTGSNGSPYQLDAPCINLQPANHSQFDHVQNNLLRTNLPQEAFCEVPYRSPGQSSSPYGGPFVNDELKYDTFPKQSVRSGVTGSNLDVVKTESRRKINNDRERVRVKRMNSGFDKLNETCNKVNNREERLTKVEVLKTAYCIITKLEAAVLVSSRPVWPSLKQRANHIRRLNLISSSCPRSGKKTKWKLSYPQKRRLE